MKKLALVFLITLTCLAAYKLISYYHRPASTGPSIDEKRRDWLARPTISTESQDIWREIGPHLWSHAGELSDAQINSLSNSVLSWLTYLREGTYESLLAFRKPDSFSVLPETMRWLSQHYQQRTDFLKAYAPGFTPPPGLEEYAADPASLQRHLEQLTPIEQAQVVFRFYSVTSVERLAASTFHLDIHEVAGKATNDVDRLTHLFQSYDTGYSSLHRVSPFRYRTNAQDVLAENGRLVLAFAGGVFRSKAKPAYPICMHVTFYWAPQESAWRPFEAYMSLLDPVSPDRLQPRMIF